MRVETWAAREVYFDNNGDPLIHRDITPLTDAQIDRIWIMRDCIEAIQQGDVLSQVRCAARAIERAHGIGEPQ